MTGLVRVGKGRRHHMSIMQMHGARGVCALRALVFEVASYTISLQMATQHLLLSMAIVRLELQHTM